MLGSISILVNVLTGPAMLDLPATYVRSGVLPTTVTILFISLLASWTSLHFANTISKIPGNSQFEKEIEFSESFRFYYSQHPFVFVLSECIFFLCITCLNISSIVYNGQVLDTFLGHFGGSWAFHVHTRSFISWSYQANCTDDDVRDGFCVPFDNVGDGSILISAGNLVTCLLFLPLALMDLKENVAWQILSFLILIATSAQFIVEFCWNGIHFESITWWGTDWSDLFGVILFNFSLVLLIPAWLYEREPHVDVPQTIYASNAIAAALYIVVGLLGACGMPHVSENMLESMLSGYLGFWMEIGGSVFAFFIIGLGIPLFSVLTRLNLTGSGLCSRSVGNICAVYFPFLVSFLLYDGQSVKLLLSWGGTIFTSLAAFLMPLMLSLHVSQKYDFVGSIQIPRFLPSASEGTNLAALLAVTILSVSLALVGTFL